MKALIRVLSCAHSDIQCKPKNRHFTCAIAALRCIDIGTWHPVDRWGSDKSVQPIGLSLNVRHSGWTSSPLVLAPSALRTVWNARIFFPLGIFEIFWGCYTPNPTDHTTAQLFNGDCSPAMCEAGGSMTEVDRATWVVRGTVRLLDHRTRLPMFGDAWYMVGLHDTR